MEVETGDGYKAKYTGRNASQMAAVIQRQIEGVHHEKLLTLLQVQGKDRRGTTVIAADLQNVTGQPGGGLRAQDEREVGQIVQIEPSGDDGEARCEFGDQRPRVGLQLHRRRGQTLVQVLQQTVDGAGQAPGEALQGLGRRHQQ